MPNPKKESIFDLADEQTNKSPFDFESPHSNQIQHELQDFVENNADQPSQAVSENWEQSVKPEETMNFEMMDQLNEFQYNNFPETEENKTDQLQTAMFAQSPQAEEEPLVTAKFFAEEVKLEERPRDRVLTEEERDIVEDFEQKVQSFRENEQSFFEKYKRDAVKQEPSLGVKPSEKRVSLEKEYILRDNALESGSKQEYKLSKNFEMSPLFNRKAESYLKKAKQLGLELSERDLAEAKSLLSKKIKPGEVVRETLIDQNVGEREDLCCEFGMTREVLAEGDSLFLCLTYRALEQAVLSSDVEYLTMMQVEIYEHAQNDLVIKVFGCLKELIAVKAAKAALTCLLNAFNHTIFSRVAF